MLRTVRIVNCYDAENIDKELFDYCKTTVFSEPQLDNIYDEPDFGNSFVFPLSIYLDSLTRELILPHSVYR